VTMSDGLKRGFFKNLFFFNVDKFKKKISQLIYNSPDVESLFADQFSITQRTNEAIK
jgi:hypothetical protein